MVMAPMAVAMPVPVRVTVVMPMGVMAVPVVMIVRVVCVRHGAYVSPHRGRINALVGRPGLRRGA